MGFKDETVNFVVTENKLEAYGQFVPPVGGHCMIAEELLQALKERQILWGIDEALVHALTAQGSEKDYALWYRLASGRPSVPGRDGALNLLVDPNKKPKPALLEDGSVDFKQLDPLEQVQKGRVLARLTPPTEGTAGMDVYGREIPAKAGKARRLPKGKNTAVTEDGTCLIALSDGKVDLEGGRINVRTTFYHTGSIDTATGNIRFQGDIVIQEHVLSGFEVTASGGIEVRGQVEGALLIAGGNIVLSSGIRGMGRGLLKSGGDILCRFMENATAEAQGSITAESVMHSHVRCGNDFIVSGRHGVILGGYAAAAHRILAVSAGSPGAAATCLEVGCDPLLQKEYQALRGRVKALEEEMQKYRPLLHLLRQLKFQGRLPQEKDAVQDKLERHDAQCGQEIEQAKARMEVLQDIFTGVDQGMISILKTVYPGVQIKIGNASYTLDQPVQYVSFIKEKGNIVQTPYRTIQKR